MRNYVLLAVAFAAAACHPTPTRPDIIYKGHSSAGDNVTITEYREARVVDVRKGDGRLRFSAEDTGRDGDWDWLSLCEEPIGNPVWCSRFSLPAEDVYPELRDNINAAVGELTRAYNEVRQQPGNTAHYGSNI